MATGLDAQQKIFASNPDDRRAFEALEEHYFLEGDWEALAGLYRDRLEAPSVVEDVDQRAPLLFRLGQILEERILDLAAASEIYWALARLDPTNRPALRQLRGIHERREQWDMVLQIAELESATRMPPYERAVFESDLGRVWQTHLSDPDEARAAYERALDADPDFPAALEGLAELHREAGRLRDAALILERLTDRLRGPERAPVWIALGGLYAGPLEETAKARKCFAAALEDDPFQAPAVEWALLLATADEDWPVVSELLENRFDLASGARARAAIAVEASQIQLNHLGSAASARAWVDRALELGPEDPAVLLAASDVERVDGDRDAQLEVLDRLLVVAGQHAPRTSLLEAAELHAEFGHHDRALDAARRAAERSGHRDERILLLQARLLREGGAKRDLAEVLEILTDLEGSADAPTRAAWLRELATLHEEDLGDEAAAEQAWARAYALEPGPGTAFEALDRLYRKRDDWGALRATLESALDVAGTDATPPLAAALGTLVLERFDDPGRARALFEQALGIDADCGEALAGLRLLADADDDPDLLLDVCEREARRCHDALVMSDLVASVRPILEARNASEPLLEWAERWTALDSENAAAFTLRADLEQALDRTEAEVESRRSLARLQSGPQRAASLQRQAALHRSLGQSIEAAKALELALEAAPGDTLVIEALCEAYRVLEKPAELARNLRLLTDRLPPEEQAEPLEELAATLHDHLGDIDTAIVIRWRLAELPDAPAEAPGKLEALLDQAGRYAELAQLLVTRRAALGDDTDEAFELDMRRATLLLDSLGHCDEAAEIFATLHARHPESDEILDLLERALRGGDDPAALCDLLERRVEWTENAERKAEIRLERAMLMEEAMGDPHGACDLYDTIVHEHPDAPAADRADRRFEALLESTGQWSRLRERLEERAEALPDPEQADLREEMAVLCRDRLQDIAGAADQLERVAQLDPERVYVWQQLEEIYARDLDRPADWLRVVEAELDTEPESEREFNLRVNAARLCLDADRRPETHDEAEAYEHYERVLELSPAHAEAAEVLAVQYAREDRHADAAQVMENRLERLGDEGGADATDLRLRLARTYAGPLEDDPRARPLFEATYRALGPIARVAEPLAALYERADDAEALAAIAGAVLERDLDADEAHLWRLRLGRSEHALGNLDRAAVAYRAVLAERPDDREIEDALIEVYERLDESDPLTEVLERRLDFAPEDDQIEMRLRLARLHADGRDDATESLRHLEWILSRHPQHRDAFERATEVATRVEDWDTLLALFDRALSTALPDAERAGLCERRGRLLVDHLDSPEQAVLAFRESLSFDRQRESARAALRTQLERLERWPAVLDCLFVEASEASRARKLEIYEEAAALAWEKIGPDASLPWLARLRDEQPDDPEIFARLAEVHRRAGRFEAALRALDEEIARRSDGTSHEALHLQRARLLERELHAPGRAIQAYRDALGFANEPDEILAELDRLLDLMGRPAERAEILEARLEYIGESERTRLRRDLATLYCVDLNRPERAIPHLEANVDAITDHGQDELAALGALEAALRATGRQTAWVDVAERELALLDADPELAESTPVEFHRYLREELARTWDESMGNADRALVHVRALCEGDADTTSPQAERLRDLLRRTGRQTDLARALTRHVEAGVASPGDWLELARLREEVLLDLAGAREAYRQAEADPALRLDGIRGRRRTSERLRDWEEMASALEDECDQDGRLDLRERTTIARRLGDLCRTRLGAGERAAAAYRRALDLDARDLEALRALIGVLEATGDAEAVVDLYHRELELLSTDRSNDRDRTRRSEVWLRIASLCAEDCDRPRDAVDAFLEAGSLGRLSAPDELRLARLYEDLADADARDAESLDAWFDVFGRWCDREDGAAALGDHLRLAEALRDADRARDAAARAERATTIEPESDLAWGLRGELAREAGEVDAASEAFERAAQHAPARPAAEYALSAARCLEATDAERAYAMLERALELDPGRLDIHVDAARVAAGLGRDADTMRLAERAIELAEDASLDDASLGNDARRDTALFGGRAARALEEPVAARALFSAALAASPDEIEALEGVAEADFEDGDFSGARALLERRVELGGEHPDRARHLAMIARGLEADDLLERAWTTYEEAIAEDRSLDDAHGGLVRVHERTGRTEEALVALERWSEAATDNDTRACAAFRAAEHALALERKDTALTHLEFATETDPDLEPAWLLRCELAADREPDAVMRALCDKALAAMEPGPLSAQISLRAARLAEVAGDLDAARERYGEAARWDVYCSEAALCESRLARTAGDWVEAEAVLARFLEAHPDDDSPALAHVHLERGRLLSGPLEAFEDAIVAYEEALRLAPELAVARASLGRLLLHAPERWREAVALHRAILEQSPTNAGSLRAIAQIAERRGASDVAEGAGVVLRTLGLASPREEPPGASALRFAIHPGPPMADAEHERLRRIAHQVREELEPVLRDAAPERRAHDDDATEQAIRAIFAVEDELSAPGLTRLAPQERQALFGALAALFLDPGGNGTESRFRGDLDGAIGRWSRRKVRRIVEETTLEAIEAVDPEVWSEALRAIAAAQVVDRNGGDLLPVLRALIVLEAEDEAARSDVGGDFQPPHLEGASIGTLASASDAARRLLTRVAQQLCDRLEHGR